MNTADAIAAIFELVKFINTNTSADNSAAYIRELLNEIKELSDVCGLIVEKKEEMLDSSVEALIEERQAARKAKNLPGRMKSGMSCLPKALSWRTPVKE